MSRLVLNIGTAFSDTGTWVPSRGFRPVRALRRLTRNMPKPRSSTRSPCASAVVIVSKMVLTIFSTSRWYRCGFSSRDPFNQLRLDHAGFLLRRLVR